MNTRKKGFTLIEVTIVLGIIAILVALAIPSFQDTLRKSRRADAMDTIMDIHLAQEKHRVNNPAYGDNAALNFNEPQTSAKEHFDVTVSGENATSYIITATANGDQVKDYCGNFILTNAAGVITRSNTATNADLCWRK